METFLAITLVVDSGPGDLELSFRYGWKVTRSFRSATGSLSEGGAGGARPRGRCSFGTPWLRSSAPQYERPRRTGLGACLRRSVVSVVVYSMPPSMRTLLPGVLFRRGARGTWGTVSDPRTGFSGFLPQAAWQTRKPRKSSLFSAQYQIR